MYYKVETKCGHVGRNNYVIKSFPIIANNKKEAALIARSMPRVKHHQKDAVRDVVEISELEYYVLEWQCDNDPYFRCKNIQEQRTYCNDIVYEEMPAFETKRQISKKIYYYDKQTIKHPKRYDKYIFHGEIIE